MFYVSLFVQRKSVSNQKRKICPQTIGWFLNNTLILIFHIGFYRLKCCDSCSNFENHMKQSGHKRGKIIIKRFNENIP